MKQYSDQQWQWIRSKGRLPDWIEVGDKNDKLNCLFVVMKNNTFMTRLCTSSASGYICQKNMGTLLN